MRNILLLLALCCLSFAFQKCRTRSVEELHKATSSRVVWTPHVRKAYHTSDTFLGASEFAGVMMDGVSLENVAPCVMSVAEVNGGKTTFHVVRGGTTNEVFPAVMNCQGKDGVQINTFKDVAGEIFVVVHGNARHPRVDVGFGEDGELENESFTPDELADLMVKEGLSCDHHEITFIVTRGGFSISNSEVNQRYIELYRRLQQASSESERFEIQTAWGELALRARDPETFEASFDFSKEEIPFVTLFTMALKERGLMHVVVRGFRGEVSTKLSREGVNQGPYGGIKIFVTPRVLAEEQCKGSNVAECASKLLAPCEACLLENAKNSHNFFERVTECRKELRSSEEPEKQRSASICGTESVQATNSFIFLADSTELP